MTMASLNKVALESDEEDELELLRLAALKSLKPKTTIEIQSKPQESNQNLMQFTFGAAQTTRHHNRGFRSNSGRGRNGLNSRIRNTNLISIQTIDPDEPKPVISEIPKLILPQDRYHKKEIIENSPKESSGNKFDRYDNSDDSESDSDDIPKKRERKNSVDLLMDELDNEINLLENKEVKIEEKLPEEENKVEEEETPALSDTLIISETIPDLIQDEPISPKKEIDSPLLIKSKSRSPYSNKSPPRKRKSRTKSRSRSHSRSPPRKYYPRALSPLPLNTITLAPLSPRSAAFVLENRQILARRRRSLSRERSITPKRSPRRRSPVNRLSPRKRSLSPRKRSLSPRKRSISPRKRSISPRKRSLSPKRRSFSPKNRRSPYRPPKRSSNSPFSKNPVHKRLGSRPNSRNVSPLTKRKRSSRSLSLSLSPSPDRNYHKRPLNETTGHLNSENKNRRDKIKNNSKSDSKDPILEARRKKFESPVQINNGIIKLKLPEEAKTETNAAKDSEEEIEEILVLNPILDDLWSDEESDDENEGRFKSKSTSELPNSTFRKKTERIAPLRDNERKYKRQRRSPLKTESDNADKAKMVEEKKEKRVNLVSDNKNANLKNSQEKNVKRKVKIQKIEDNVENNEKKEEFKTNVEDDGGDLRAELSRRRAERLFKAGSIAEALPTRLLKNALQEVVPKRPAVPQQSTLTKGGCIDRRVLIVKTVASTSPPATRIEPTNKVGNNEGKLPIHMRLGSNPDPEEPVRSERRNKRPRTGRRKKQVQV